MTKKALIIGTGLGGLATGMRLIKHGYEVDFVEKYHQSGGRLNQLKKDGFTFDLGPSFFSMSYEFDELVKYCDTTMPFEFVELDPLYSVNFKKGGKNYLIYKDLKKLAAQFAAEEPNFEKSIHKYLKKASELFHDTEHIVIKQNFNSIAGYLVQLAKVPWKHAPMMVRSIWSELDRNFDSYEVKVILSLIAFFLGATPFDTPAVYSLLSYTELQHDGYYNVKGGMYKIVEGMEKWLRERGAKFNFNTEIVDFRSANGQITSFIDQNDTSWQADVHVVNADAAWFRGAILNRKKYSPEKLDKQKWTLGPFTIYLGIDQKIPNINHHNYFLGENFKDYAGKIFKNSMGLDKPYYYVNALSKFNTECAPEGMENLFILCPVPDLRFKPDWSDREEIAHNIIGDLSSRLDFDIEASTISKTILDPTHWQSMFNLYKGSGLGLAHDLNQIGGFRPRNIDEKFNNVYYVGASTVPGTGLPMTIISSKLVTERILKSYGSLS